MPKPRLSADLLGLGTRIPRGVPFGLLSALAARAFGGQPVEKALLVLVFVAAAWGAARLVPSSRPAARAAAGVLYAWNPFVYERLLLGHAPFLLSYAALPWVIGAALRVRRREPGGVPGLVVSLGVAAFASSYGGLFAAASAVVVVGCPPRSPGERPIRAAGATVLAGLAVNLPWLVPAALRPGGLPSPALAFELFHARSDSPLGLVGSLLSLGGLWRTDLAPPGRDTLAWVPALAIVLVVASLGWMILRRKWPPGAVAGLGAVAALGLLLAVGVSLPGVGGAVRWAGIHLPGGGILRDSQKFVAPLAVAMAVGFGLGVERLLDRMPARRGRALAVAALVALPVALAPTLAWGASGRLFTAEYPPSWDRVRTVMAADPAPGAVLVLPWHLYLPYGWNRDRVVIQPAPAFFTRAAVVSDRLEVGRAVVPPEDPWSALADPVARAGGPLAPSLPRLGVRYVLLIKEADWRDDLGRLSGLARVVDAPDLALYRSLPARPPAFPHPPAVAVAAGDLVAAGVFGWGLVLGAARSRSVRRRRPSR